MKIDDLSTACERFCASFSASTQSMGSLRFSPEKIPVQLPAQLSFSEEHRYLYEHVAMEQSPTLGGDMFLELFEPSVLRKRQDGWRWDGRTGQEILNWKPNWTVFADRNGDALFAEALASGRSRVYGAIQSRKVIVAESIEELLNALATCIEIEEVTFANDTRNDDMSHKPEFLDNIRGTIASAHAEIHVDGFMHFFFE